MKKISTLYRWTGRSLTNYTQKQRQLLRPLNNLKKNPDPSEKERTYNIRKQQTRFNWVCSWELMENATFLVPLAPASAVFCFPSESKADDKPTALPQGVLSFFLHTYARAQHLLVTLKKHQEFQGPPESIWNFSNPKNYPSFCSLTLRKDPKMHRNDP